MLASSVGVTQGVHVLPRQGHEHVSVESRVEALAMRMEIREKEVRQVLAIHKTTILARVMATHEAPRVEVPKQHTFSGKRDAKELDNFLWHMELL